MVKLCEQMFDDVPQGDHNGPTQFVITFEELREALDAEDPEIEEIHKFQAPTNMANE